MPERYPGYWRRCSGWHRIGVCVERRKPAIGIYTVGSISTGWRQPHNMAELTDAAPQGVGGLNPPSVSKFYKRRSWPHIGFHDDRLSIRFDGYSLCIEFTPYCPQCKKYHHPNVARSGWGAPADERHCNRCKIRWEAGWQPFCSSYSAPSVERMKDFVLQMVTRNQYARCRPAD